MVQFGMADTLRDLRKRAGFKAVEAAQKLHEVEPTAPETHVGLIHIENRGTDRVKIIRGLATVYGFPFEVVEEAAKHPAKRPAKEDFSKTVKFA
jgi:hypothetical protein